MATTRYPTQVAVPVDSINGMRCQARAALAVSCRTVFVALLFLVGSGLSAMGAWYPYDDGFEGQTVGDTPAGWDGNACASITGAVVHSGSRALEVSNAGGSPSSTLVELSDLPETYKVRFCVNFGQIVYMRSSYRISFCSDAGNDLIATVLTPGTGIMTSHATSFLLIRDTGETEPGRWYEFSYEIDAANRTYRLSIDDVPVTLGSGSPDFAFQVFPLEEISRFKLKCGTDQGYSVIYVDDISMPEGSGIDFANVRSVTFYNFPNFSWQETGWFDSLKADLPRMKAAGFNTIWLVCTWRHFQPSISPLTLYQAAYDNLLTVVDYFKNEGMYVILPHPYLGQGWAPDGLDYATQWPFGADYYAAFEEFAAGFVDTIRDYDNAIVLFHHEGFGNPNISDTPLVRQAMIETYQAINPDIDYWNAEFGTSYSSFNQIPVPGYATSTYRYLIVRYFRLHVPRMIERLKKELEPKCAFGIHDFYYAPGFLDHDTCIPGDNPYDVYSGVHYPLDDFSINNPAEGLDIRMANLDVLQLNIPVIFGECGLSLLRYGWITEQIRADFFGGCTAYFLGNALGYNFWQWQDFAETIMGRNGLIYENGNEKPAYYSIQGMAGHLAAPPGLASTSFPQDAQTAVPIEARLRWNRASNATMYDVYFGTSPAPSYVGRQVAPVYGPPALVKGTTYYWRIVAVNPIGTTTGPVWSFTTETDPSIIEVIYPNGGEVLHAGASIEIAWISSGCSAVVAVEYSIDGGDSWTMIDDAAPNSGACSWDLPDLTSRQCLVRITDIEHPEAVDTSDDVFAILRPEDWLWLRVSSIDWWSGGTVARIHFEANQPVKRYYTRLYQLPGGYGSTSTTNAVFSGLGDGYYLFIVTARDTDGYLAPSPCRVWFINKTWGSEFQVYLAQYTISHDSAAFTYTGTTPCSRYYTRLYDVESAYTGSSLNSCSYTGLADGLYYFIVTGKDAASGAFPVGGPARQFFYVNTVGF